MSTLAFAEDCNHADTAYGSPGNGWNDLKGDDWRFLSQLLRTKGTSGGQFVYACMRPAGEVTQNGGQDQASVTYGTCLSTGAGAVGSGFAACLRQSGSGATFNGYVCLVGFNGALMRIKKVVNGVQSDLTSGAFAATVGAPYALIFEAFGINPTVLTAKIYKTADIVNPLKVITVNDSQAAMQIAGQLGLSDPASQFDHSRFEEWNYDGTNDPTLIQAGISFTQPSVTAYDQTTASLAIGSPSGGQSPYNFDWQHDTDPLFSALAHFSTSQNPTDAGLTPGTLYFARCVVTDSGTPQLTATSSNVGYYTPKADAYSISAIGDSINANAPPNSLYNPIQIAGKYLELIPSGLGVVKVYNQSVPGLTSVDWKAAVTGLPPGSYKLIGGVNSNVGSGQLLTALNNILAGSPVPLWCYYDIGPNDSKPGYRTSAADYLANVQSTCQSFVDNGVNMILGFPTFVQDGANQTHDPLSQSLMLGYLQAVLSIVNGSTIRLGDATLFYQLADNIQLFGNGSATPITLDVHPNNNGVYFKGWRIGRVFESILFPSLLAAVLPTLITSGIFFFALKGYATPAGFERKIASYLPAFVVSQNDASLSGGGLQPPFSLAWVNNLGNQIVTVKDGVWGVILKRLLPGEASFLERGNFTLGKNTPAVSGGGTVEYCLWT